MSLSFQAYECLRAEYAGTVDSKEKSVIIKKDRIGNNINFVALSLEIRSFLRE